MEPEKQVGYKDKFTIPKIQQSGGKDLGELKMSIKQELQNIPELSGIKIDDKMIEDFLNSQEGM
jgi:hypothetical protein